MNTKCAIHNCNKSGKVQFAKSGEYGLQYYYACLPLHADRVADLLEPLGFKQTTPGHKFGKY